MVVLRLIKLFLISISIYLKHENGLAFLGVVDKTNKSATELGMV